MLKKIKAYGALIVYFTFFAILFVVVIKIAFTTPNWGEALTTHTLVLKDTSRLKFLWVQTVYTHNFASRTLAATNGAVFFIGSLAQNEAGGLIALDEKTGNELWQVPEPSTVDVNPEVVYMDVGNTVVAYTLIGEKLWQTRLPGARNVALVNVADGKLYVNAGGSFHILDATTGELLNSSTEWNPGLAIYYWNEPVFTEHRVFRGGETVLDFEAIAINRQSGDILWQTTDNVISNVAATNSLAFVITYEDELRILDARTGKLFEKIRIEPSINFFGEETNVSNEGYFLAVDQTTQTLYVLLGDSNQLFAFRIHE